MCKDTKKIGLPVFGDIIKLLDKQGINKLAKGMSADRYTKKLDAYQHLVIMLYAVFGDFKSLRELEIGFLASSSRMNHFGLTYMAKRSTLSEANSRRKPAFFEAVYMMLYRQYESLLADSRPVKGLKKALFIMDSTTITLFSQIFRGTGRNAINGQKKGGIKAHSIIKADEDVPVFVNLTDAATSDHVILECAQDKIQVGSCITFDMGYVNYEVWQQFSDKGIFYVTREKRTARHTVLETREIPDEDKESIVNDEIVMLSWTRRWERPMTEEELSHRRGRRPKNGQVMVKEKRSGKHKCRRITKYKDNKEDGTITFITNDFDSPASVLCEVYRRRWQIETLFKRLKQNFPLKYFMGDSQNAIQNQIRISLIAWLLTMIIKRQVTRKWSLSNLMTVIRILMNSYEGLYEFLELPEREWMKILKQREEESRKTCSQLPLFST